MTAPFEGGREELVETGNSGGFIDEAAREDNDVGIVMLTDEVGDFWTPHQSCAHALVLVEGHADALSAAADGDTWINTTIFNGFAQRMTEVGVVTTGFAVGSEVTIDDAALYQVLLDEFLKRVASMVAG